MKLAPGTTIGRYTVEENIGEGGMATVYRVRHNELHATYALKVLNLVSEAIQRRLVQEGRVQARLRHPNILPVTDILDVDGRPGLIMEYVPGDSLEIHLATRHLPLDDADQIAKGILSAVAFAHSQGVVHRDLKPANILLADYGGELIPKVADFGLVKVLGDNDSLHKTRSGIGIGTPCYMAPEQALDAAHVDERADVFSLGAILYELVCGQRAFHGPNAVAIILRIAAGVFTPPEELCADLPERMLNAIHGAMQIERSHRIQDCQTLREVWRGKQQWTAPAGSPPTDATWSEEAVLASADAGLSDLQDIIRSIAEKPRQEAPAPGPPPAAPAPSSHAASPAATAVPPELPAPPRLPTMDISPLLDSRPDPEVVAAAQADSGTLADDLALDLHDGMDSVSEELVTADPEAKPTPPPPPAPAGAIPDPRQAGPVAHAFPAAVSPTSPQTEHEEPEQRRSALMPRLMLVLGLLAALGLGGVVIATLAVVFSPGDEPVEQVEPESPEAPVPELDATPAPVPDPPTDGQDMPGSSPVVEPTVSPEPGPEPVAEVTPVAAPVDAASEPTEVKAAPPPLRTGIVQVTGDMVSAVLISKSGRRRSPGEVPVGTYDLEVGFANGKTVTRTDMVEVTSGGTVTIKCFSRVENCR